MRRTHVWVVTPRDFVRAGVIGVFEREGSFEVRAGGCSEDAASWADVVLFDALSLHDSAEDLRTLARDSRVVTVALTHGYRPVLDEQATRLGAAACVGLDWSADKAVAVVRTAVKAAKLNTRRATRSRVTPSPTVTRPPAPLQDAFVQGAALTSRERDVLTLVAMGLSNQQIEQELFLSANSIKSHIRGAYGKIGVTSRTMAVVWCYENGLVRPSGAQAH